MTHLIYAPWTAEQVTALNAFQHHGRMHPFTCGAEHASGRSPVLIATNGGWVCPDPQCVYRQDWAHAFMVERGAAVSAAVAPPTQAVLRDFLWRLEQSAGDAAAEKFLDDNPELRRMADETATETPDVAEPTAEDIAREHVTSLHLIGEQLATIESWFWEHLADVRAAGARQDEPVVTAHTAPDLSPAAERALGALIDVAKQQALCDFEHPHPEHPCGRRTADGARQDGDQP